MKIYDISQEVFSSDVYPGDPAPSRTLLSSISNGDACNLTAFSMCAHNGTHIDAPYHFFDKGNTVEKIPLSKLVGYAFVAEHSGVLIAKDAESILNKANQCLFESAKRILIKGTATVSAEAAKVFADANIYLIGNESQTVGPRNAPKQVHEILLNSDVVLLEGIRLKDVPEGVYLLNCAPILLSGCDGSPCRAILIDMTNI